MGVAASRLPHFGQNAKSEGASNPQPAQIMVNAIRQPTAEEGKHAPGREQAPGRGVDAAREPRILYTELDRALEPGNGAMLHERAARKEAGGNL